MDPREILPPEMWELVFDKVEDSEDWYNLYNTSPYFQAVVGEKRTTALFPQVLSHVLNYEGSDLCDFLGLRLVCRPWTEGVDKILGVRFRHGLEEPYYFRSSTRVSSFLDKFATTHCGNPFLGKFAAFWFNHSETEAGALAEYSLLTTRLLEKFGAQLKTLEVAVFNTNFEDCVSPIQNCLRLVPNLDSLKLDIYNYNVHHRGNGDEFLIPHIERGPHPPLHHPNLKSISFIRAHGSPRDTLHLRNALVRLFCNPNSLTSVRADVFPIPSELLNYPNLESVDVVLHTVKDCSNLLSIPPWPLSKLTVSLSYSWNGDLATVFKCVRHFKATLTSLHFKIDLNWSHPSWNLDLPRLTHLTVHDLSFMHLNFFASSSQLPNLEVLSIVANQPAILKGLESKVSNCRLWEGLPKLAKICLLVRCEKLRNRNWRYFLRRHVATRSNNKFQYKGIQLAERF